MTAGTSSRIQMFLVSIEALQLGRDKGHWPGVQRHPVYSRWARRRAGVLFMIFFLASHLHGLDTSSRGAALRWPFASLLNQVDVIIVEGSQETGPAFFFVSAASSIRSGLPFMYHFYYCYFSRE